MSVNVPATIWQSTQGNTEFSSTSPYYIVDTIGVFLADPSGVFVVDTGVSAIPLAATIWREDNSF